MSINVLFVCLGNICRSPTAHGVFQHLVDQSELSGQITVDSCGTGSFHIGEAPDPRTVKAAARRQYDLSPLRARQLRPDDFDTFHYVLAMDRMNLGNTRAIAPPHYAGHIGLFLDFSKQRTYTQVPDPYYEGDSGFELVLDLVEDASTGLLEKIRSQLSSVE
jgi:protein-tyrosine phosphatase